MSETYFPGAVAIVPQEEVSAVILMREPLLWTSTDSWLEKDLRSIQDPKFNEGIDREGPLAIGVLIAAVPTEGPYANLPVEEIRASRLIVMGDSDFASNQHFYSGANGELFLKLVNELVYETELVEIERKILPFRRMILGPEARIFITYSSIGLLPILILAAGVVIWWRRR